MALEVTYTTWAPVPAGGKYLGPRSLNLRIALYEIRSVWSENSIYPVM